MEQNSETPQDPLDFTIVKEEYVVENYPERNGQMLWQPHTQINNWMAATEKVPDPNTPVGYTCPLCGISFKREWYLKMHMQKHSTEGRYNCCMCNKKFINESVLDFHIKKIHLAIKPSQQNNVNETTYTCGQCGDISLDKNTFTEHLKLHSGATDFQCLMCPKTFMHREHLKEHMLVHVPKEQPVECYICHKMFESQKVLQNHKQTHYKVKVDEKLRTCAHCGRVFCTKESAKKHVARVHRGLPLTLTDGPVECTICCTQFPDLDSLKAHVPSHPLEMSVECETCGKAFADEGRLKDHRRFVHEKYQKKRQKLLPRFPCPQCGKLIKGKAHLQIHMTTHSNETPVECSICFKKFKYQNMVTRHIKIHARERPNFPCHICGAQLSYKETLKTHMKKHESDQGPTCVICNISFNAVEHLQQHMTEHHNEFPVHPIVVKTEIDDEEESEESDSVPGIDCEVLIKTEGD